MGRPKKDLGPGSNDRVVAMMARGQSRDDIARELGCSPATAGRRMAAAKGGVPAARLVTRPSPAAPVETPAPLPSVAEDIPEETPLEQIAEWLQMAKEEADAARSAGDVDNLGKMLRIASTLLALQQKHTPVVAPDLNDNPDFIAAAARVRKRWHDRLDALAREYEAAK